MNLLFCGDVVGQSGRHVLYDELPRLRRELELDFVVVNGENAAGGFGITASICEEFYDAGVDVITTGNHVRDQREFVTHFARDDRVLRPHNYPPGTPGTGTGAFDSGMPSISSRLDAASVLTSSTRRPASASRLTR